MLVSARNEKENNTLPLILTIANPSSMGEMGDTDLSSKPPPKDEKGTAIEPFNKNSSIQSNSSSNSNVLLVSAGYDSTIRFWEALNGVCTKTLQHPESHVNALAITNDKTLLAVAGNPSVTKFTHSN